MTRGIVKEKKNMVKHRALFPPAHLEQRNCMNTDFCTVEIKPHPELPFHPGDAKKFWKFETNK